MSFQSPIHVLYNKDLSQITEKNLKMWRKELMLRFDLEEQTTIELNGIEFDKNGIIEAFERLRLDTDFHIRLFKNEGLLDFIEKGQVYFFNDFHFWEDFKIEGFWSWIGPAFISTLQDSLYKYVSNHNIYFIENLKTITKSGFQLSSQDKDEAYSKAYHYLDTFIKVGRKKYETPFFGKKPRQVKKEVKEYLNESTFLILKNLPTEFNALKANYGAFAHNVIYDALHKQALLTDFKKDALELIKTALHIDIEFRNDTQSKELLQHVETVLKGGSHPGEGCAVNTVKLPFFIIMLFMVLVRFGTVVDGCNKPRRTNYNNFPDINFKYQLPVQLDTTDFIGTWKTKYPQRWAGDTTSYQKTMTFFNDSLGVLTFSFPTGKSKKECIVTNFFRWEFQIFGGISNWNKLELIYTTQSIKNGDSTDLALPNRVMLDKIKTKLGSKKELVGLQTFPLLQEGRNIKKAIPRGYAYTKTPKVILDYYKRNKPKEFETFQKITQANEAREYLVKSFQSDYNRNNKFQIKVLPNDLLITMKYSSLKKDTIGNFKFRKGKAYLNPTKWYIPGDPCSLSGRIKGIRYLNQKGKPKTGNLELCFHYNEGYFLREGINLLPEIKVSPK